MVLWDLNKYLGQETQEKLCVLFVVIINMKGKYEIWLLAMKKAERQKVQMVWWYAYHAGIDDLPFPRLWSLQQRQHYPQSARETTACKVCHQIQRGVGLLPAASKPGQKTWENKEVTMWFRHITFTPIRHEMLSCDYLTWPGSWCHARPRWRTSRSARTPWGGRRSDEGFLSTAPVGPGPASPSRLSG